MKKKSLLFFLDGAIVFGVTVLVLAVIVFFSHNERGSISILHYTSNGEGCHIFSSDQKQTVSLFVFGPDPQGYNGMRQIFQVDIRNHPDLLGIENTGIINETGEARDAFLCLKWASEDPETEYLLPQSIRGVLANLSQDY